MKRSLVVSAVALVLAGCATFGGPGRARYPNAVTPKAQAEFEAARALYEQQRLPAADSAFASFIASSPYTQLTDEARFLRGEIAFMRRDYAGAQSLYREAYSQVESPTVGPRARFKAALALHRIGRNREAIAELEGMERRHASAILRLRADSLGAVASAAAGIAPADSVVWSLRVLDDYSQGAVAEGAALPGERLLSEEEALDSVRAWVADKSVSAARVETLPMREMRGKRSGGYVLYKLALAHHSEGNSDYAGRLLKSFISGYPKHEYYGAARLLLAETGGMPGEGAGIAVGVILPLSGRFALYGNSVLHGIECAIGMYEPCVGPGGVRLVVRDSESFPGGVAAAIDDIANDREVVAIIGPLQSAEAPAAAARAQELRIPMVSLSQRAGVAETGDYVFRNSVSMESEIKTLLDYAVGARNFKRFYVIYPDNRKGAEYYRMFARQAEELGGNVVSTRSYQPGQLRYVSDLRGRGAIEQVTEDTSIALRTGVSYDAIFIPDSPFVVGTLLQIMMMAGDAKVQLLGIPRWNNRELAARGGEYVEGAIFVDSFHRGSEEINVASFVSRIKKAYGAEPTLLEALGYDTMNMIATAAIERGALRRDSMRRALSGTSSFPGVAGLTTFDENGDARHKMRVLTVKGGEIVAVN